MVESMVNGISALSFAAQAAGVEEGGGKDGSPSDAPLSSAAVAVSMGSAMLMAAGLFIYTPHLAATMALNLASSQPLLADADVGHPAFHAVAGLVKMTLFVSYILLISRMKEIRRVFQYHGAEHKSIYTWEAGQALTVENARRQSTLHPRCGTSFLIFVILISIGVFTALFPLIPMPEGLHGMGLSLFQASLKLPLMLPIAGLSYEFIRWAGKKKENPFLRAISWPGLMMQRLTTREPDDDQLEVALVSLKRTLEMEGILKDPQYVNCSFLPRAAAPA